MEYESRSRLSCLKCGLRLKIMKRCVRCKKVYYCSRECQIKNWETHRVDCVSVTPKSREKFDAERNEHTSTYVPTAQVTSETPITIRCNHTKHKINLINVEETSGEDLLVYLSAQLRIPRNSMKIIGRGKLLNKDNVKEMLLQMKCRMFQAFGEEAENEKDLDARDIEAIMDELHVSRNKAIRSLRSCNGDLIDAILEIGNNL